jgi:hypothetical protein
MTSSRSSSRLPLKDWTLCITVYFYRFAFGFFIGSICRSLATTVPHSEVSHNMNPCRRQQNIQYYESRRQKIDKHESAAAAAKHIMNRGGKKEIDIQTVSCYVTRQWQIRGTAPPPCAHPANLMLAF